MIANLLKVKLPFEPSSLAEAAGIAALDDSEFLYRTLAENARGMHIVRSELAALNVETVPSEANFVMTLWPSEQRAAEVFESLLRHGVITRPLKAFGIPNGLRITIGSEEQNEMLLNAMNSAVREEALSVCK